MAEIILKVGSVAMWDDGDVVEAVNDKITTLTHIEMITAPKNEGFNSDGLRPTGLAKDSFDRIYEYRFDRISKTEVVRSTLGNDGLSISEEVFGRGSIDVEEFVLRRRRNPNHKLFGVRDAEFWYGGKSSTDKAVLDSIWDLIEFYTPNLRDSNQFKYFPLGTLDKKHFLAIPMDDFVDDAVVEKKEHLWSVNENGEYLWTRINQDLSETKTYSSQMPEEEGWEKVIQKSRVRNVDWINQLEGLIDPLDVLDMEKTVDIRMSAPNQSREIQQTKYNSQNITPTR